MSKVRMVRRKRRSNGDKSGAPSHLLTLGPSDSARRKGFDAPDVGNRQDTPIPERVYGDPKRILGVGLHTDSPFSDDFDRDTLRGNAVLKLVGGSGTYGLGALID